MISAKFFNSLTIWFIKLIPESTTVLENENAPVIGAFLRRCAILFSVRV